MRKVAVGEERLEPENPEPHKTTMSDATEMSRRRKTPGCSLKVEIRSSS